MHKKQLIFLALTLLLAFTLSACVNTGYDGATHFAEPGEWGEDAVIIDARSADAYAAGHLEGAIHLPPGLLSINEPVGGLLAPKEQVEEVLGSKGITPATNVYVYDDNLGVFSGRVWWAMKAYGHESVRIINGGFEALTSAGLPMSTQETTLPAAQYSAQDLDRSIYASFMDTYAGMNNPDTVLIDTRSQAEYDEGHIPGVLHYPHTNNVYSDGTFHSTRDIGLFYGDAGVKKDAPIILYCKTSFRATQAAALLLEAGFTNVRVYDGAWDEWVIEGGPVESVGGGTLLPSAGDGS